MNKSDLKRNLYMLNNRLLKGKGYDWWWQSFTTYEKETGKQKAFFIECFLSNPALGSN